MFYWTSYPQTPVRTVFFFSVLVVQKWHFYSVQSSKWIINTVIKLLFDVKGSLANSVIITFSQWVSENNVYCCYRDQTGTPYERRPLWRERPCVQCHEVQWFGITNKKFSLTIALKLLGTQTYVAISGGRLSFKQTSIMSLRSFHISQVHVGQHPTQVWFISGRGELQIWKCVSYLLGSLLLSNVTYMRDRVQTKHRWMLESIAWGPKSGSLASLAWTLTFLYTTLYLPYMSGI